MGSTSQARYICVVERLIRGLIKMAGIDPRMIGWAVTEDLIKGTGWCIPVRSHLNGGLRWLSADRDKRGSWDSLYVHLKSRPGSCCNNVLRCITDIRISWSVTVRHSYFSLWSQESRPSTLPKSKVHLEAHAPALRDCIQQQCRQNTSQRTEGRWEEMVIYYTTANP
jgi:hypothetical protein